MSLKSQYIMQNLFILFLGVSFYISYIAIYHLSFYYYYYCGDQLSLEVLFKLDKLGLWPNNPVRGRGHIRGQSIKEEIKIVLQEELKGIYSRPTPIQGERSPQNFYPRWLETSQSP